MMDTKQDRAESERFDALERLDRDQRGMRLCPTCGAEIVVVHRCGCKGCPVVGCKFCMLFDADYGEFFCGEFCLTGRLIEKVDQATKNIDQLIQKGQTNEESSM